jgi:hypothetical protein
MNTLDICNSALIKVGAKPLRSLEDDTPERDAVVARYAHVRDMLLRGHIWKFSKDVAPLASTTADYIPTPWTTCFLIPSNCLRIISVNTRDYEIMGRRIFCAVDPLVLRYIKVPETTLGGFNYPADFGEAFACYLASEVSMKLTQDPGLRGSFLQQYSDLVRSARFNGAVEGPYLQVTANEWLVSRDVGDWTDISARDLDAPPEGE